MAVDTDVTPTAQAEHEYDVNPDGSVRDWRDVTRERVEANGDDDQTIHVSGDKHDPDNGGFVIVTLEGEGS